MRLRISVAARQADVLRCQYFIAERYNRHFGIMFSEDMHDLESRIEPYPQSYLMGVVDGELVATMGLYTRDTYVERYGGVTDTELAAHVVEAGVGEAFAGATTRELTKLVVKEGWGGHGLARCMHEASHSQDFMAAGAEGPVLLLVCGKVSLLDHMFAPRGRVKARYVAPFPRYEVHEAYRSDEDPMETRLVIPTLDVPAGLLSLRLPMERTLPLSGPLEEAS